MKIEFHRYLLEKEKTLYKLSTNQYFSKYSNYNARMEKLTKQELHNLAMNIVGKELEAKGYEFLAVNSTLNKHPQFVCIDKNNKKKFILVKAVSYPDDPKEYDVLWMETFKQHVEKFEAELYFAGVGLGNAENPLEEVMKDQPYILDYDGLIQIK